MLTLWAGLSVGAIYILVAVGFNIVFVATGTLNFAQPQYMMLGTFLAYTVAVTWNLSPALAIIAGAIVGFAISAVEERIAVRPLTGSGVHGELVTTVGWSVMMQGSVLRIWGSEPREVPGVVPYRIVSVLGGRITVGEVVLIATAIVLSVGVHVWSRSTLLGIASLAAAEDREAAMLRGVNTRRLAVCAFGIAGGLMAALGPIVGPKTYAVFSIGSVVVIKAFFAMSIGGFGSTIGALIGGFSVGIIEAMTNRHLGTNYVNIVLFVLFMTLLLVHPTGLFGEKRVRVV